LRFGLLFPNGEAAFAAAAAAGGSGGGGAASAAAAVTAAAVAAASAASAAGAVTAATSFIISFLNYLFLSFVPSFFLTQVSFNSFHDVWAAMAQATTIISPDSANNNFTMRGNVVYNNQASSNPMTSPGGGSGVTITGLKGYNQTFSDNIVAGTTCEGYYGTCNMLHA
jgi:hypothetical protein